MRGEVRNDNGIKQMLGGHTFPGKSVVSEVTWSLKGSCKLNKRNTPRQPLFTSWYTDYRSCLVSIQQCNVTDHDAHFCGISCIGAYPAPPSSAIGLTAAFGPAIGTGHPGVFGEQYSPPIDSFIPLLMAQGFTMERLGIYTSQFLPDTTLSSYKANINGVQDPANWDFTSLAKLTSFAASPSGKNMKFMITISTIPPWLSYNGNFRGVPR